MPKNTVTQNGNKHIQNSKSIRDKMYMKKTIRMINSKIGTYTVKETYVKFPRCLEVMDAIGNRLALERGKNIHPKYYGENYSYLDGSTVSSKYKS